MKRFAAVLVLIGVLGAAPAAVAHGGDEPEPAPPPAAGEEPRGEGSPREQPTAEEAEEAALAAQPARVLAQQALALLTVRNAVEEAVHRVEAALKSKQREDVDVDKLRAAMTALEAGDSRAAASSINEALGGGPAPADEELAGPSDEALHNAGEEFEPANNGQEVVGGIAAIIALVAGAALLMRHRRATRAEHQQTTA